MALMFQCVSVQTAKKQKSKMLLLVLSSVEENKLNFLSLPVGVEGQDTVNNGSLICRILMNLLIRGSPLRSYLGES